LLAFLIQCTVDVHRLCQRDTSIPPVLIEFYTIKYLVLRDPFISRFTKSFFNACLEPGWQFSNHHRLYNLHSSLKFILRLPDVQALLLTKYDNSNVNGLMAFHKFNLSSLILDLTRLLHATKRENGHHNLTFSYFVRILDSNSN